MSRRPSRRAWKMFSPRDGREVERQCRGGIAPCCPCCGGVLEAEPQSRLASRLPLDASGYDLCCRGCRRFWCVVQHTARSLRLVRMRRLVAAIRAVPLEHPVRAASPARTVAA